MTNGQVTVKEHLEKLFEEFKERYLSDQKLRDEKFEDFKKQLDKEGKLLAEKYKSDLQAYPNIDNFNDLQTKVTTEFSSEVGKAKAFAVVFGLLGLAISLGVGAFAILK